MLLSSRSLRAPALRSSLKRIMDLAYGLPAIGSAAALIRFGTRAPRLSGPSQRYSVNKTPRLPLNGLGLAMNTPDFSGSSSGEILKPSTSHVLSYSKAQRRLSGVSDNFPTPRPRNITFRFSVFIIFLGFRIGSLIVTLLAY